MGVRYAVYFAAASEYFGLTELPPILLAHGYNFGLTKMEEEDSALAFDGRIKHTVKAIVVDFFQNCDSLGILMINYDDYDGKQEKRYHCFDRWFNDFNAENKFYKEDAELILPATAIKVSLLLLTQHNDFYGIMQEFHEVRNRLVAEK